MTLLRVVLSSLALLVALGRAGEAASVRVAYSSISAAMLPLFVVGDALTNCTSLAINASMATLRM